MYPSLLQCSLGSQAVDIRIDKRLFFMNLALYLAAISLFVYIIFSDTRIPPDSRFYATSVLLAVSMLILLTGLPVYFVHINISKDTSKTMTVRVKSLFRDETVKIDHSQDPILMHEKASWMYIGIIRTVLYDMRYAWIEYNSKDKVFENNRLKNRARIEFLPNILFMPIAYFYHNEIEDISKQLDIKTVSRSH